MKQITDLIDLLIDQLKSMYTEEMQQLTELPAFIKLVKNEDFKMVLQWRMEQTKKNSYRIEKVLEHFGETPSKDESVFIKELVKQTQSTLLRTTEQSVREAKIILFFQCIGHYKIANYGAMTAFAKTIGKNEDALFLERSLKEEKRMDRKLTILANQEINREANLAAFA